MSYHMDVLSRQNIMPECSASRRLSHGKSTVIYDIMQECCAKKEATVLVINIACTEYYSARTDSGDETKTFLFTVSNTIWRSS